MKKIFSLILLLFISSGVNSQVLTIKEQSKIIDDNLTDRINNLLPKLMEINNIDMWVMITREYNEDPIIKTLLPSTWLNARRRTILVFYYNAKERNYKKLAIARYKFGTEIESGWDPEKFSNQWEALNNIIETYNPQKIALNISDSFGHADGLDYTDYQLFTQNLQPKYKSRIVSAEPLAVAWLETRTSKEMELYPQLVEMTHQIIAEGFSNKVITAGVTTSDDLVWWFRQKVSDMGLSTWFHPSVEIQRNDSITFDHLKAFTNEYPENVIREGDLLHVDFGITYLRLNTDVQEHAYVLHKNEKEAPKFLTEALKTTNRLQDILTQNFKINRTGNTILAEALAQAKKENINATIYTHPIGFHGHAAGPTIGMWDQQNGVPGSGDFPLHENTCYSIELNAAFDCKEWNKTIKIMLEQNGFFNNQGFRYINGRQTSLHLVSTSK